MRISTKGRFAVNAMIDLALRDRPGPVALAAIAARLQLSLSYLEQLFSRLRRNELVSSTRGPGGGYTLARDAATISVDDIVTAIEDLADTAAGGSVEGELGTTLWTNLDETMRRHMATITLQSLVAEQLERGFVPEVKTPRRPTPAPRPVRPVHTSAPNSVFAFGQSFSS